MGIVPICPFPLPVWWYLVHADLASIDCVGPYVKQTFRNRFHVLGANGVISLTLPVEGQCGQRLSIRDIRLTNETGWRRRHLQSIRSAYGKSAFFIYLEEGLISLYSDGSLRYLVDFNQRSIALIEMLCGSLPRPETEADGPVPVDYGPLFDPVRVLPGLPPYPQVFADRFGYVPGMSMLDVVMNMGPDAMNQVLLLKNAAIPEV